MIFWEQHFLLLKRGIWGWIMENYSYTLKGSESWCKYVFSTEFRLAHSIFLITRVYNTILEFTCNKKILPDAFNRTQIEENVLYKS
jgi:hypothetical protein